MKIGIISSSNGSAFKAFYKILSKYVAVEYIVVLDRECGIKSFLDENNIQYKIIEEKNNDIWSNKAFDFIKENGGVDFIFLFYTRLVTKILFDNYPTINFHPSLLPAYKGFNPIKKALDDEVKYFGTTMHFVEELADSGKIISQAIHYIAPNFTEATLNKISFVQKVYMMLLFFDIYEKKCFNPQERKISLSNDFGYSLSFNPTISNDFFLSEIDILNKENNINI